MEKEKLEKLTKQTIDDYYDHGMRKGLLSSKREKGMYLVKDIFKEVLGAKLHIATCSVKIDLSKEDCIKEFDKYFNPKKIEEVPVTFVDSMSVKKKEEFLNQIELLSKNFDSIKYFNEDELYEFHKLLKKWNEMLKENSKDIIERCTKECNERLLHIGTICQEILKN